MNFFLTGKFRYASNFIIFGLANIVLSILNIFPGPEVYAKIAERELVYDEDTRVVRKKRKIRNTQIMIVLSVIGLAIIVFQWYTRFDYTIYTGFGLSFEYPKDMKIIDSTLSGYNVTSTKEQGSLRVLSEIEGFGLFWRSDWDRTQLRSLLDVLLDFDRDLGEVRILEYLNYRGF